MALKQVTEVLLPDTDLEILGDIVVPEPSDVGDVLGVVDDGAGGKEIGVIPLDDIVGDYIPIADKGVAGGVAELDGSGKVPVSQMPLIAINEVFVVADEAAMLALTAQRGDMAKRTDESGAIYVLATDDPTDVDNWIPIAAGIVSGGAARDSTTLTATVAALDTEVGSVVLAKGTVLFGMRETFGRQCRVRLYGAEDARDADVARPYDESAVSGSYPAGTGLTCDVILADDTAYALDFDPKPIAGSPDSPPVTTVYWTIDNLNTGGLDFNVVIRHTPFEA